MDIGDAFTLYLYGAGDRNLRQTAFTVGGVTESTTGVPGGDHDLTEGEDYVVFNGVLTSSSLTIDYTTADPGSPNYSAEGEFNGLQLTETPEPSSRALFVAGGFALVFLHRRLRKRSA